MVAPLERNPILINLYTQRPYLQRANTKCCPMPKGRASHSQRPDTFASSVSFKGLNISEGFLSRVFGGIVKASEESQPLIQKRIKETGTQLPEPQIGSAFKY
jgi:hypothetical protein